MDSFIISGHSPLTAFVSAVPVQSSVILERVAGYLATYKVVAYTPNSEEALEWLGDHPEVVEKGLREGVELFHNNRPQPATSEKLPVADPGRPQLAEQVVL